MTTGKRELPRPRLKVEWYDPVAGHLLGSCCQDWMSWQLVIHIQFWLDMFIYAPLDHFHRPGCEAYSSCPEDMGLLQMSVLVTKIVSVVSDISAGCLDFFFFFFFFFLVLLHPKPVKVQTGQVHGAASVSK